MRPLAILVLAGAAALSAPPGAPAQVRDGPIRERQSEQAPYGLPPASKIIGPIRRDESGKIVPVRPAAKPGAGKRRKGERRRPARRRAAPVILGDTSRLQALQSGEEQAARAAERQREIDRILAREAEARRLGAPLDKQGLTRGEADLLRELVRRHSEVLAYVRAKYMAALPFARPSKFWYVTGPGRRRFVAEVLIRFDLAPVKWNAEATVEKLERLKRAALAPDRPSDRDREVASELERLISGLRGR